MKKGEKKAKKILSIISSSSLEDTSEAYPDGECIKQDRNKKKKATSTSDSESSSEDPEIVEQKDRNKQKIEKVSTLPSFEEDQGVVDKMKKKQIIEISSSDSESEDEQAIEHRKKRNVKREFKLKARKKLGYPSESESSVSKDESDDESLIKKKKKDKKRKRNVSSSSSSTDSGEVKKKKKDKKRKRNVCSSSASTDSDELKKKKKDKKRKRNVCSSSASTDSDELKKKKKDKKRKRNVSSSSASTDSDEVKKKKKDKKWARNVSSSSASTDSDEVKKKKDKKWARNVSSSSSSMDSDEVKKKKKDKKWARNLSSSSPSTDSDEVVQVQKRSKDKEKKHMKTEKCKKVRKGKKSKKQKGKHGSNHSLKIQKTKKPTRAKQRCSMLNFYSLLKNLGKHIPDGSWLKINETVFGPMIMVLKDKVLKEKDLLKRPEDFEDIMKYYDAKGKFNFGGTVIEMSAHHVQLLFDIPNKGIAFRTKHDKENNCGEPVSVFKDITTKNEGPTRVQIVKRLETELAKPKCPKGNEQSLSEKERALYQNDGLIASLVIMHLLSAVLFPRTGTNLTWDLVAKALDLEKINTYNWAHAVYEFLVLGLSSHDKTKIKYINGCLLLVQYWFLESTSYRSINLDQNLYGRPRFCRWDTTTMFDAHDLEANPTLLVDLVNGQGTMGTQEHAELDVGLSDHSERGHRHTCIPPSFVRLTCELKILVSRLLELAEEEKKDEAECLSIDFDALLVDLKSAFQDILMKNDTTIFELEEQIKRLKGYTDKRHNVPKILTNPPEIPTNPPEIPTNPPEIPTNPPEIPMNPSKLLTGKETDKQGSQSLNPFNVSTCSCNFIQCTHFMLE